MRPFHTIAIPHDDILQGRLTMDVFAADLWKVHQNQGPEEYRVPDLFFQKTYLTAGLQNLFDVVQKRLEGRGGDPVIQMQTPFGGGKTHALIALYHKAREWGVKTVVISGTPLAADETLWGLMAEQLQGSRAGFEQKTAPGRMAIERLLAAHQPVLILMDEVLEYVTKAAGVVVGESNLASQTLAFMQELTEAVSTMEKAALVVTLPTSALEHFDENAVRLFEQLKKISGRVQKIFTPVQDHEVGAVIRRRLFARVDEAAAREVVNAYIEQALEESLLSAEEAAAYRERFMSTYPFLPEVIDVLYHRWGSFPTFQRTRGTLRLLALVVNALKASDRPWISLADFALDDSDIRRELLEHIGNEYDSVLAADITSPDAGARKANQEIGKAYQGLRLGERVATTIFMYSHLGGGGEAGATLAEIKRQNLMPGLSASVISDLLQILSDRALFYLHEDGGRFYFTTTANLNRALTVRKESITPEMLRAEEREILYSRLDTRHTLRPYLWPEKSADVPDDETPKLLILPRADTDLMREFVENKGQTPRVHRNTLYFLAPQESERSRYESLLREALAARQLLEDETVVLTPEQRRTLENKAKQAGRDAKGQIGMLYRLLYLPEPNGFRELDLGYSGMDSLNQLAYERLRSEGRLLEKIAPLVIVERYLKGRDTVATRQLAESGSRTPGAPLPVNRRVWETAIAEGVRQGLFGLGRVDENGQPECLYFKELCTPALTDGEVLIRADLCRKEAAALPSRPDSAATASRISETALSSTTSTVTVAPEPFPAQPHRDRLTLRFTLPFGQASHLLGLINLLQQKFKRVEFTIHLSDGQISEADIEDKVRETFRQIGTDVDIQ